MYELAEVKKDFIASLLDAGKRADGRALDEYRPISVEKRAIAKAEGSALVKIGQTQVLVGVKMALGEPFPDMPNSGVLTTNAELIPMASPTFEKGPPDEDTVELARVVDRGIRESHAIDMDKLCITKGEKVWIVFVDIHVLDYDGNLFDASALGAIASILDTRLPKVKDDRVIYEEKTEEGLPIGNKPVETTFAKIGNHIVLDPSLDEELVTDARLTVATDPNGIICAMQKGGSGTFTKEEVHRIVQTAREKGDELRKYLE